MISMTTRVLFVPVLVAALASPAHAQGLLDGLFGRRDRPPQEVPGEPVQRDLSSQIERLEQRVRELTGELERAQHRGRMLEQQLQSAGIQPVPAPGGAAQVGSAQVGSAQQNQFGQPGSQGNGGAAGGSGSGAGPYDDLPRVIPAPGSGGDGRSDAFDPSRNPDAPGVPRALGSMPPGSNAAQSPGDWPQPGRRARRARAGIAARSVGAVGPAINRRARSQGGPKRIPACRRRRRSRLSSTGPAPTQPPSNSPRDHFDLAYGYMLRKDFALAEQTFESFLERHPRDERAGDAQYWLGESLFQRQRFEEAAERFLEVSTKHAGKLQGPRIRYCASDRRWRP